MNEEKRGIVEKRLQEERRDALESLGRLDENTREVLGTDDGELSNYPLHMADEGTDTMEREKSMLLASTEGRRLIAIEEALRRLYKEPEDFGNCMVCGKAIAEERLELVPWTTTCAEHAEQDASARAETD